MGIAPIINSNDPNVAATLIKAIKEFFKVFMFLRLWVKYLFALNMNQRWDKKGGST